MSAPADAGADLAATRALLLYVLSLEAVASAHLAWSGAPVAAIVVWALLLAGAYLAGVVLQPYLASGRAWKGRTRTAVGVCYAGALGMALVALLVVPHPWLVRQLGLGLAVLQVAALWLAGLRGESHWALVNAIALTIVASLAGGFPAALAAVAGVALIGLTLAVDHVERTLAGPRRPRGPWAAIALRQVALPVGSVTLALTLFLLAAPPRPHPRLAEALAVGHAASGPSGPAYQLLLLICLSGGLGFYAASRLVGREGRLPPLDESVETVRLGEEILEPEDPSGPRDYRGTRGRIVQAYLRFLARSAKLGFARRPTQTPREFLSRVHGAPPALGSLTDLFVAARYGSADPSESDARRAEQLATEAAGALRQSRHTASGRA